MLVAETRGKSLSSIQNREDYLTSAVFGHLRYLPPSVFWPSLLRRAESCGDGSSLEEYASDKNLGIARYDSLNIDFWRRQGPIGEPDMILEFRGKQRRTLRIVTEVKLWSGKSNKYCCCRWTHQAGQ